MGPPGCGKSFLGSRLAALGIARYTELEPILVERFGTGERFAANKDAALRFIRDHFEAELRGGPRPVAFESTGVSDRPLLESLVRDRRVQLVKVDTPKAVCIERVAARPRHRNLSNDAAMTERVHDFWYAEVAPTYDFAAAVDGADTEAALATVRRLLESL